MITYCKSIILLTIFFAATKSYAVDSLFLHENWQFRQAGNTEMHAAEVPGVVQLDLLRHGMIPDPFYGTNEDSIQWIERKEWVYELKFDLSEFDSAKNYELVFDGLDTYAEVTFNGEKLLETNNMFRQWRVDVARLLRAEENHLIVHFKSPLLVHQEDLRGTPYHKTAENDAGDDKVSVYTRKAPYHFGWDWGPRIVTCGIWRPVYLLEWSDVVLDEVQIYQDSVSDELAQLRGAMRYRAKENEEYTFVIRDAITDSVLNSINVATSATGEVRQRMEIPNPKLWWTHNLGEPHLYEFIFEIKKDNQVLASKTQRFGIRTIELVREPDKHGETFYFKLNGVPVFMKGANYIPSETMLPRRMKATFDRILNDAKTVNMNMIRVWGGGIYEEDYFYDKCDEMGLLVYQDFMFACSMYPGVDTAFYENVKQEAIENVRRLRHHPSIAIWCGNNEVDNAWHNWGWQVRFGIVGAAAREMKESYRLLFQELLPEVVAAHDPQRPYVHTSPLSATGKSGNTDNGSMHYWKPWNGNDFFDGYAKNVGRYMNEYGFQSFPEMATIDAFSEPEDWALDSEVMKNHQKSYIGNGRIEKFVNKYYPPATDFQDFVYKSQLVQMQGITTAIREHRKAMPYCMGSVYWQLDDCWPASTWSSIDYYGRWKALHYALREVMADVLIAPWAANEMLHVQVVSDKLEELPLQLEVATMTFNGRALYNLEKDVSIKANHSDIYAVIPIQDLLKSAGRENTVLRVRLRQGEDIIAETLHYFTEVKDLELRSPDLQIEVNEAAKTVTLSANTLVKNIHLTAGAYVRFDHNYFDILPGETVTVSFIGELDQSELKWQMCNGDL